MKVKVEGLRELEAALMELKTATARNVGMRTLRAAGEIFAEDMRGRVDVKSGDLRDSIGVSTKLTRRQKKLHRKGSDIEVFAGAGGLTQAITEEFGTENQVPDPSARPAWDATQSAMLDSIKTSLAEEIEKARARAARKALRAK